MAPRRAARFVLLVSACAAAAFSQSTATPPYSLFEYSTLTGSGNTITASWVPIVTATGTTIYKDITLQFDVDSAGNLTLAPGFPQVTPSPALNVANFQAGKYVGLNTYCPSGQATITVSGPGVAPGGATEWSLGASCSYSYPSSATWYVGNIANNPLAARIKNAGITSTAWSYGIGSGYNVYGHWAAGSLLGFSQTGNAITIATFTSGGVDHNTPIDQITYTLAP